MTPPSKNSLTRLAPSIFLSADDLRARTFVRHIEIHDTLDSTNNRAIELARDPNIELPALVVARHQTAGRGRGTNKWWSADGALTFSLLINPATHGITVANWPQFSLTTAVAVCDAIVAESEERGVRSENNHSATSPMLHAPCSIKWPNDVLINNRKVAGILLESPGGAAPAKDRLVIGIGINVNNSWQNAPADAMDSGVALCDVTNQQVDLQAFLTAQIQAIFIRIDQLRSADNSLVRSWQRLNWLAGQNIVVSQDKRVTAGRCIELAEDGALVIDTPQGPTRFFSGSVRLAS